MRLSARAASASTGAACSDPHPRARSAPLHLRPPVPGPSPAVAHDRGGGSSAFSSGVLPTASREAGEGDITMVHVTERAREMFRERLDHLPDRAHIALRIGTTESGLGLFPDRANDDDQIIEHEGLTVLVIDREVSEALAGKTIDVEEQSGGARFVLRK